MNSLCVTGTGTDVGKTYVSSLLLKELSIHKSVVYYKPLASGCETPNHIIDCDYVQEQTSVPCKSHYVFKPPLAPYAVQDFEPFTFNKSLIIEEYQVLLKDYDFTLLEGIGGVYVPIEQDYMVSDLMADLHIPTLIVADAFLGTLNHTLLTIEHLRSKNIDVKGVILNETQKPRKEDPSHINNGKIISDIANLPIWFTLIYGQTELTQQQKKILWGHVNTR